MPLNRAPFNALVDDDGSNTTGTVWNKAQIQNVILDPVDAALGGSWQPVPFSASNFWPGVTAGHVVLNYFMLLNSKTMFWMLQLSAAPVPSPATAYPQLIIPGSGAYLMFNGNALIAPVAHATDGGVVVPSYLFAFGGATIGIAKSAGGDWTGPTMNINFSAFIGIA